MRRIIGASCLALALAAGGCEDAPTALDADATGKSRVSVFLADGPGAVEAVWLQFDQIYLIRIDGTDGSLVELLDEPTGLIEVTSLVDSVKALALAVPVEPGAYHELRLILGGAVLESEGGKVYTFGGAEHPDGLEADGQLQCPSCAQSGLKVVFDVDLDEGTGDIVLDFDVGQSFGHVAGKSGRWIMRPVIRALHDRHDDDDDDDHGDDDDDEGRGRGRGRGRGGDQDRFASVSGTVKFGAGVTVPPCPAGKNRSLEDFLPTATARTRTHADGSPFVATGHVDDDDDVFKIWRLQADTWTLGYEDETVVSDAGHTLRWTASVTPADVDLAAGGKVTSVAYTITGVTCAEPAA